MFRSGSEIGFDAIFRTTERQDNYEVRTATPARGESLSQGPLGMYL